MQKRLRILVSGRVQGVGYRGYARLVANRYGLSGYASNEPDGRVCILVEGDEAALDQFIVDLHAQEEPLIEVHSVEVTEQQYTGEFTMFEPHFGDFQKEMFVRSELALEYMREMIKLQKRSLKTQTDMIEALRDMKKESKKRRDVLERMIEAIHSQG
ncbi:MAG: acylphosphatase [Methanospirillum sp.]|uniref:acylphosphatase n=1 Tax=Methanospirillum sp. TaxID=45200 RepID=UPI00236F9CB5|nr:acylphosphatase [Methanospirillum sp.]MDD1730167.1 acylphosphatase [Methanospirillum sp.]